MKNDSKARINIRISEDLKREIEEAAALRGQSVTDFTSSTLVREARSIQEEARVTQLSNRDRDLFLQLLDENREPSKTVKSAVADFRRWQNGEVPATIDQHSGSTSADS